MEFKGLTLDPFQVEAIEHVEANRSVVVSAATGTGKTLIADYTIKKFLDAKRRVIYTAPIKALSNQKYKDFIADYGKEQVGMMTGDVVINPDAPLLVMTTEIFRNMLLARDDIVDHLSYVIFDEIHFISDRERGTVWEESIIFSPNRLRFLCLSATIPNAKEFAEWIGSIKEHDVRVVSYMKRAVPLTHYIFEKRLGITTLDHLSDVKDVAIDRGRRGRRGRGQRGGRQPRDKPANHIDLVTSIEDKMPAIYFVFSRKKCEQFGQEISRKRDYTTPQQKREIVEIINKHITPEVKQMGSYSRLRTCLNKGVAYHHAGLLPNLKDIVERLFEKGLISVLYATDTFAVGINMPAKAVCFDSLEKFDGMSFRYLNSKEYFQCAGRAGRRGIDKEGSVFALIDRQYSDIEKIKNLTSKDRDPIISQFRLSFNSVLNLCQNHPSEEEIDLILKSNFDYFLKQKGSKQVRIRSSFNNKVKRLTKMGYLNADRSLTDKGVFTTHIYFEELLISEMFCSDLWQELSDVEINCLIAGIIYEERRADRFKTKGFNKRYSHICKVIDKNEYVSRHVNKQHLRRLIALVSRWSEGVKFIDLLDYTNLLEGDIIRLFRRMIDIMKQVTKATRDNVLADKMYAAMKLLDRDIVRAEFEGD